MTPSCDCPMNPHHRWNCPSTPIWAQTCRWYANIHMRDGQLWTLSFGSTSGRARGYANAERVQ